MLFTPLIISVMGWKVLFLPELALPAWCVPGLTECVPGALPPLARSSIMLLRDLWQWVPLFALLCLARLRHIQRVQYQSVLFDGGSGWAAFRLLEWPWLRGALALGAALGCIAVIVRQEIMLFIMGGVFVAETVSVMLQVSWFKYTKRRYGTGRRIFRMAPLHHHFEVGGVKESQVVVRFWIVTMVLVLFGLSSLKLR